MNVLSLFDGISCTRVALERQGIPVEKYYSSEIDKYAITIAQKNYPDIIQLGDITKIDGTQFKDIDLMIGGFPCQDLSIAKSDRVGLKGARSGLFWECIRLLEEVKPKYFIFENVESMPKKDYQIICETLGVMGLLIDANLVSAQNRKRYFWTNINVHKLPDDRGIFLKDILEPVVDDKFFISKRYVLNKNTEFSNEYKLGTIGNSDSQGNRVYSIDGKSTTLSANGGGLGAKTGLYQVPTDVKVIDYYNKNIKDDGKAKTLGTNPQSPTAVAGQAILIAPNGKEIILNEEDELQVLKEGRTEKGKRERKEKRNLRGKDFTPRDKDSKAYFGRKGEKANCLTTSLSPENYIANVNESFIIRKLTPIECERLQGLEDNYTNYVSDTQRYKALGNAFNVDVVAHILSYIGVEPETTFLDEL